MGDFVRNLLPDVTNPFRKLHVFVACIFRAFALFHLPPLWRLSASLQRSSLANCCCYSSPLIRELIVFCNSSFQEASVAYVSSVLSWFSLFYTAWKLTKLFCLSHILKRHSVYILYSLRKFVLVQKTHWYLWGLHSYEGLLLYFIYPLNRTLTYYHIISSKDSILHYCYDWNLAWSSFWLCWALRELITSRVTFEKSIRKIICFHSI